MQSYVDTNGVGEIMITVTNRNANWKDNEAVSNESPNADKTRLQLKERGSKKIVTKSSYKLRRENKSNTICVRHIKKKNNKYC